VVNHPQLRECYSGTWLVKNETEVVLQNGGLVRPDRVVVKNREVTIIDYKTGERDKEHLQQVESYKQAFLQLGFDKVKGLLVYLGDEIEVVEVH